MSSEGNGHSYNTSTDYELWEFFSSGFVLQRLSFIQYDLKNRFSFVFQITYIETSAKDPPMNVDKAFHELVRVIRWITVVELTLVLIFMPLHDYEII